MTYNPDLGLLVLRVVVGIIFIYHSLSKLRSPEGMAQGIGWPTIGVRLLGLLELVSGLLVLLGLRERIGALGIMVAMLGALYYKIFKWKVKFWARDNTGWEFDLLLLACAVLIYMIGAGSYVI